MHSHSIEYVLALASLPFRSGIPTPLIALKNFARDFAMVAYAGVDGGGYGLKSNLQSYDHRTLSDFMRRSKARYWEQ